MAEHVAMLQNQVVALEARIRELQEQVAHPPVLRRVKKAARLAAVAAAASEPAPALAGGADANAAAAAAPLGEKMQN